jgi:hypothetical protein
MHQAFAMKGVNDNDVIHARLTGTTVTGIRDSGAGILRRTCAFEFTSRHDATQAAQQTPQTHLSGQRAQSIAGYRTGPRNTVVTIV